MSTQVNSMKSQMTHILILCYLLGLAHLIFNKSYFFFRTSFPDLNYKLIAFPLNYININPHYLMPIFFVSAFFIYLLCLVFYKKKISQIIASTLYILTLSLLYSRGKINHSEHAWIAIAIGICFLNIKKPLSQGSNLLTIRTVQGVLLSHYLFSGLWKLRYMIGQKNINFETISLNHMAVTIAEGTLKNNLITNFLTNNSFLIVTGFIGVLIFQISCIIPILKLKYYKIWAILILLFHFSTELSLGINFKQTRLAILLLLFITPILMDFEKNKKASAE